MADLMDYETGTFIRTATETERTRSEEAAKHDGGAGIIMVDGRKCYVEE